MRDFAVIAILYIANAICFIGAVHDSWPIFYIGLGIAALGCIVFVVEEYIVHHEHLPKKLLGQDLKGF